MRCLRGVQAISILPNTKVEHKQSCLILTVDQNLQKYNPIQWNFIPAKILLPHMDNIPNLKYKTTLCLSWAQGILCQKAEGCYFAHGQADLRTIEQNREAVAYRNKAHLYTRPPENYKTIFCRFYGKGECKLGDACTYAHERREKKIRKANTISYEMEHQYALYAYYAQLNPWIQHYTAYPQQSFPNTQQFIQQDPTYEEMKMSSETASSQREASPVQKTEKSSQECGKFAVMEAQGQVEGESCSIEISKVS